MRKENILTDKNQFLLALSKNTINMSISPPNLLILFKHIRTYIHIHLCPGPIPGLSSPHLSFQSSGRLFLVYFSGLCQASPEMICSAK